MLSSSSIISFTLLLAASLHASPIPPKITLSHHSTKANTTTITSLDPSSLQVLLPAAVQNALADSTLNLNLITERAVEVAYRMRSRRRINNSTINLTVVGGNSNETKSINRSIAPRPAGVATTPATVALAAAEPRSQTVGHHSILIDASSFSNSTSAGGIHNSTININLNSSKKRSRRSIELGHHSILLAPSPSSSSPSPSPAPSERTESVANNNEGAIENTLINANILPRSTTTATSSIAAGHHSIVLAASSAGSPLSSSSTEAASEAGIEDTTLNLNILPRRSASSAVEMEVGHHSVVIDTASSSAGPGAGAGAGSAAIKNSTVNLTIVGGNE